MLRPKILITDDEPAIAASMGEYFEHHRYAVDVANEFEEAEALLATNSYEVVITDLRLTNTEREEGLALVQFARQRSPRAVVIVLTAFPSPHAERVAAANGACLLLHKSQPLSEIERRVRVLLDHCVARGSAPCPAWCNASTVEPRISEDLRALGALLSSVRREREDEENASTLTEIGRVVSRLSAEASPPLLTLLASCLCGSSVFDSLLSSTAGQARAAEALSQLATDFARMDARR